MHHVCNGMKCNVWRRDVSGALVLSRGRSYTKILTLMIKDYTRCDMWDVLSRLAVVSLEKGAKIK